MKNLIDFFLKKETKLYKYSKIGDIKKVSELIEKGANVNAKDFL